MRGEIILVRADNIVEEVNKIKSEGYRFVTMTCVEINDAALTLFYHFDKNLELKHFQMTISRDSSLPSISSVFFAAFLVENEIQDLFGIQFTDLAVNYSRTLYFEGKDAFIPFSKYIAKKQDKNQDKEVTIDSENI